jgi:lipid-binding SYLF domain-containing protein
MDHDETVERLHSVEVAQATQAATMAGAQATQAAADVGMTSTNAAAHAGVIGMMAAGSVSLIVGIFLGIVIRGARS